VLRLRLTRFQIMLASTMLTAALVLLFCPGRVLPWTLLTAIFFLAGLSLGLGVAFPQWQMFGLSVCRVSTKKKLVALTFDDGPDATNTPALLQLLAARKVHATFFCIGNRVAAQPELAKRMVAAGHQLENHTQQHSHCTNLFSVPQLRKELTLAQTEIQRATGQVPKLFRPPVGLTNPRVFRVTRELGLRVIGYTARGLDRRNDPPEKIANRLLCRLQPGAIFLLHDAGVPTARLVAVVTLVLDRLQVDGYCCVRLDELLTEDETNR
jgi:peptidoglycan-N-acetylglucosamine deacetylase